MRLQRLVWIAFGFFAAMRECDSQEPRLWTVDGSVFISGCPGQYYELDEGCKELNELNETPTSDHQDSIFIDKDGPDVEGTYCCGNTCSSSSCVNYSSTNSFIEVPVTNISLNASAGRNFILDILAYVTIGTVSMEELFYVEFEVVASNRTQLVKYTCVVSDIYGGSNPCTDNDNYSINKTTYELNISRIDPNNPTFYINTTFKKHDVSEDEFSVNSGPTFYITVLPVVTLSIDNASDSFTCSVETSLPATLRVLLNGSEDPKMKINSTSFDYTISTSDLPQGEHLLACEVTSQQPNGGTLTSTSQSELVIVPGPTSNPNDSPRPTVSSPLPTSIVITSSPITTVVITIGVTGGVIAVLILVLIIAVLILVMKQRHQSSSSNVEQCPEPQAS